MEKLRELFSKPAIGWIVAGFAILVAVYFLVASLRSNSTYDLARLSETVTVRFTDTNDEIQLTRAEFEKQLRAMPGTLSTASGIMNPKSGKPTGILVATREWAEVVSRLNEEREWAKQNSPFGSAPANPNK